MFSEFHTKTTKFSVYVNDLKEGLTSIAKLFVEYFNFHVVNDP